MSLLRVIINLLRLEGARASQVDTGSALAAMQGRIPGMARPVGGQRGLARTPFGNRNQSP